jgi:hypothetical protein
VGRLDMELFRARRLVVDTGIHAKHWTRQQAIDYGIEASEVDRYVVNPGQACSYMMGELKILELRDKAKKALGDKFSIKEFHNAVLSTGTVPLDVLERQVDSYLKAALVVVSPQRRARPVYHNRITGWSLPARRRFSTRSTAGRHVVLRTRAVLAIT